MLVEPGDLVDLVVVVEPDPAGGSVDDHVAELRILIGAVVGLREGDVVCHESAPTRLNADVPKPSFTGAARRTRPSRAGGSAGRPGSAGWRLRRRPRPAGRTRAR